MSDKTGEKLTKFSVTVEVTREGIAVTPNQRATLSQMLAALELGVAALVVEAQKEGNYPKLDREEAKPNEIVH